MDDLISESSNVVGVSSTGQFLYKSSITNNTQKLKCLNTFSFSFFLLLTSLFYPSDPFPPAEVPDEGLARPVVAGVVATICFLAAAVLFSTLAACFVNKQHRRKLKRKPGRPSSLLPLNIRTCIKHYVRNAKFKCLCPLRSSLVGDTLQEKHRVTVSKANARAPARGGCYCASS